MLLQKGMCIAVDTTCWFVVVNIKQDEKGEIFLECICDYANNIYSWELKAVLYYLSKRNICDSLMPLRVPEELQRRGIPFDLICEVLFGEHDHRFVHWEKEE